MSPRYVSYERQGRPTREEAIETIMESYINLTRSIKRLENIYKREFIYRKKKSDMINNK